MIILSNSTEQTLTTGQSITFDTVVLHSGCSECHRGGSSSVKLKSNGIYQISFNGNMAGGTAAELNLALQLGGETLPETTMTVVPGTATTEIFNVSTQTAVRNCCGDYDRVTVTNIGTTSIIIQPNTNLFIRRIA